MEKATYNIILASNSPRRKELMSGLGIPFSVKVMQGIDEGYPSNLSPSDTAIYIAAEKADAYVLAEKDLIITADTIVVAGNDILGKPHDAEDAHAMLRKLSGKTHQVITGVCIKTREKQCSFAVTTDVTFKVLAQEEIEYYVNNYRPYDKAGAYGIQEWIGYVGVTSLKGSYFNVMGLPVQRIYDVLKQEFGVSFLD